MNKIFTPVKMVAVLGILASTALAVTYSFGQTDDKDKKNARIEKRIEIVDENGQKKVTVTTTENGNKKTETLTGEAAEEYLRNQNGNSNGNMHMNFDFNIDTLKGKNSFDFKVDGLGEELEKGIRELLNELEQSGEQMKFDFNEMFKSMDSSFSNNNFKSYSFNFNNGLKDLDSLIHQFKFDIHIDDDSKEVTIEEPKRKTIIVAHSVTVEDLDKKRNAEKDLNITDLSFYPNPNGGNFNLRYKSESMDMIDISVVDLNGKTVYNERVSATGTIIRDIELNEPSGTYILTLKQGKKHTSKKLIIK